MQVVCVESVLRVRTPDSNYKKIISRLFMQQHCLYE